MKIEAVEIAFTEPRVWGVAINDIIYSLPSNGIMPCWTSEERATAAIPEVIQSLLDNPQGNA